MGILRAFIDVNAYVWFLAGGNQAEGLHIEGAVRHSAQPGVLSQRGHISPALEASISRLLNLKIGMCLLR